MGWKRYINRDFKKLFLVMILISSFIFGYKYYLDYEKNIKIIQSQQKVELSFIQEMIKEHLEPVMTDLEMLLRDGENHHYHTSLEKHSTYKALEEHFKIVIKEKKHYVQARLIDLEGNEIINVKGKDGKNIVSLPENMLQNKKHRYYFKKILEHEGYTYISPIDLNIENNRIDIPYNPVIRLGKKLGNNCIELLSKRFAR